MPTSLHDFIKANPFAAFFLTWLTVFWILCLGQAVIILLFFLAL